MREEEDRIPVHVPEDSLARRDPEKALHHQSSDELTLHDGRKESHKDVSRTRGKGLVEGDIGRSTLLWLHADMDRYATYTGKQTVAGHDRVSSAARST